MKKLLFVLMALVATTFTSCKKEEKATLNGTWKWEKSGVIDDEKNVSVPDNQQYVEFSSAGEFRSITFLKDEKNLIADNVKYPSRGTFTNEENQLVFFPAVFSGGLLEGKLKFLSASKIRIDVTKGYATGNYIIFSKQNLDVTSIYSELKF